MEETEKEYENRVTIESNGPIRFTLPIAELHQEFHIKSKGEVIIERSPHEVAILKERTDRLYDEWRDSDDKS